MYIYKIENIVNGKVYIGQTRHVKTRLNCHRSALRSNRHRNSHLQYSWNKYGEKFFTFDVIEKLDSEMNFDIDNLERYWIKFYDAANPIKGYNKDSGGRAFKTMSAESRQKLSKSCKGRIVWNKGVPHTAEVKEKISNINRGNKYCLGRKMSEHTRTKISAAHTGKKSPSVSRSNILRGKRVICTKTLKEYITIKQAAADCDISYYVLKQMLFGTRPNKTQLVLKELWRRE